MLNSAFKAIKIKKKFKDIESMDPLTIRIEDIFNFPEDIPVCG